MENHFSFSGCILNSIGVRDDHIIEPAPIEAASARYCNPLELDRFFREQVKDGAEQYYVFPDEIQEVADIRNPYLDSPDAEIGFTDVLLGLMRLKNVDLYGTGSSFHLLSSDIMTEFRRRGDEICVNSLTYREFYEPFPGEKRHAWREYCIHGGMPMILSMKTH